jgi:protein-tyrosine-phosphatase
MQFTTGDADIRLKNISITSEKAVTAEDIIKEAVEISKKLRAKKLKPGDFDAADAFMNDMRREHKEFSQSYPIVLRYMCQMQQFHTAALRKYLAHIASHPWKNHDEYLDSQVQYVVLLYKETHKRWNRTEVDNLSKNVHKLLKSEHKRFMELSDKYKTEVEHEESGYKAGREDIMKAFYAAQGKDTLDIKLRTETNIRPKAW